jgi:vancomycin resistance protein YoaR
MTVRRTVTVGGIAVAGLVALLLLALAALWVVQRDRTLPNTSIAGIDVSRLTEPEVRSAIAPVVSDREDTQVSFAFEDEVYTVTSDDLDYAVDVDATVAAAVERGRNGSLVGDLRERLGSLRGRELDLPLFETYDEASLERWVDDVAADVDRDASRGSVTIDQETLEVQVERPIGSAEVRRDETIEALEAAFLRHRSEELELPVTTTEQPISDEELEAVVAQVERAIAEPLVLRASDESLTLEPRDLARLVEVEATSNGDGSASLALVVTEAAVEEVLGEIGPNRFDRSPRNARFTTGRTPPRTLDALGSVGFEPVPADVEIEPGRDGARFDPELAAQQLTALLREGNREAELDLEVVEPELSTERAEELRPTHLLGTFTTYFPAGANRSLNIQRLADVVDGAQVLPGGQFSIQELSGPRSCEQGYLPDGTIVQGELVDTCGGGVSQFGTTTFNAAFFTGLQLDEWKAHSWYISRYPMGREATLYYPYLDVKFTNTSSGAVLVKTSHTATSVTVSVYGQPVATRVSAQHGQPTNPREFEVERRRTDELRRGQENVLQPGIDGFTVEVVRVIERVGGGTDRQTITTRYEPQTRIIEVGTGGSAPADEDEDDA